MVTDMLKGRLLARRPDLAQDDRLIPSLGTYETKRLGRVGLFPVPVLCRLRLFVYVCEN